jgi:diguanylate cyclase (GGDEF)-like protein
MGEKKQRLLIVDDSKVIRVTARKILKDHFETVEAADGEQAWEILTGEEPVSLVVSDLTMPKLDGFGLLEKIRGSHLPQVCDLPVIIITGANDSDSTMERARAAGATDFIGKPFDSVHLLARTQAHASSHTVTNTLRQENTELEDMSMVDPLTGLLNEPSFMERGYQQLSYSIRHNTALCIYRVEIDDFGTLYQQHGREFTDTVTRSVSELLAGCIRSEDTAARVGAARFALLLPGMEKTGIRNLADRIRRELGRRTFKTGNGRLPVTVSLGVVSPEIRRDTRFDDMLALADQRLGRAIAMGGNRVVLDDSEPATDRPAGPEPVVEEAILAEAVRESGVDAETSPEPFDPFSSDNLEVEEIELAAPVFAQDPSSLFETVRHDRTAARAETPATEPPVLTAEQADSRDKSAMHGPIQPANDGGEEQPGKCAMTVSAADAGMAEPCSVQPVGTAANEPAAPSTADSDDEDRTEPRRGLMRRFLSALAGLFRHSRRHL